MVARRALTCLIKLTVPLWLTAGWLAVIRYQPVWRFFFHGHTAEGFAGIDVVLSVLAATGTICYSIRKNRPDPAGLLLKALLATPPQQMTQLRLLPRDEATPPATPAQQESAS